MKAAGKMRLLPRRIRLGMLVFRDPLPLCGVLYLLLYFDSSQFLRIGLLAACLHEWGHILVYRLLLRRWPVVEVTFSGFCMRLGKCTLSPARRALLAAAGPAVNGLLAAVWAVRVACRATLWDDAFLAANLLTGIFNLLPVPPLDGAQLLAAARESWRLRRKREKGSNSKLHFPGK